MGNLLKPCRSRGARIRLINLMEGGKEMRMKSPVYVKEIIGDYPNHSIFNARLLRLGLGRPLPPNAELQASQLYYLLPSPQGHMDSSASINYVSSSSIRHGDRQQGIEGAVLRVKLRMSKRELASFLSLIKVLDGHGTSINNHQRVVGWKAAVPSSLEQSSPSSPLRF